MPIAEEDLLATVPGLLRYARTLTRDADRAEDLVQDVLVRALERGDAFRGDSSLSTWLHSLLHNRFVDLARRERTVPVGDDALLAHVEEAWRSDDYTVDSSAVLARADHADDLRDALVHLPVILRSAVVLHDLEGMTMAEVAAIQGIGLAAAKQRLRRGRATLVTLLAENAERRLALAGVPLRCWKARSRIDDYLAGGLDGKTRTAVERHLSACPTCPGLYASIVGVRDAVGRLRDPDSVVPPAVAARVRTALRAAP